MIAKCKACEARSRKLSESGYCVPCCCHPGLKPPTPPSADGNYSGGWVYLAFFLALALWFYGFAVLT